MKGGLVVMLTALRAMKTAGVLDNAEIRIVLSGDEEKHGFPVSVSRKDMIDAAKRSDVALEFESGGMVGGKEVQSISRRSAGSWRVENVCVSLEHVEQACHKVKMHRRRCACL